jgi:hypothetical protein
MCRHIPCDNASGDKEDNKYDKEEKTDNFLSDINVADSRYYPGKKYGKPWILIRLSLRLEFGGVRFSRRCVRVKEIPDVYENGDEN